MDNVQAIVINLELKDNGDLLLTGEIYDKCDKQVIKGFTLRPGDVAAMPNARKVSLQPRWYSKNTLHAFISRVRNGINIIPNPTEEMKQLHRMIWEL